MLPRVKPHSLQTASPPLELAVATCLSQAFLLWGVISLTSFWKPPLLLEGFKMLDYVHALSGQKSLPLRICGQQRLAERAVTLQALAFSVVTLLGHSLWNGSIPLLSAVSPFLQISTRVAKETRVRGGSREGSLSFLRGGSLSFLPLR